MKKYRKSPGVHVTEYSLWDVKQHVSGYSGKKFPVFIGDKHRGAAILKEAKDISKEDRAKIIYVPEEHREDFKTDLEGSLRDIAGVATAALSPLIRVVQGWSL